MFLEKVWSLAIPSKAKHLLWRICNNSLPTDRDLGNLGAIVDESCASCDGIDDNVIHSFLLCDFARAVWFASPLSIRTEGITFSTLDEFVLDLFFILEAPALGLWAMIAWGLWFNRNSRRQGKQGLDPIRLVEKVLMELDEFQRGKPCAEMVDGRRDHQGAWVRPQRGWVKINFHVSLLSCGSIGLGGVIRDDMGAVLGSFVNRVKLPCGFSMTGGELMATHNCLLFVVRMGFRSFVFEMDCLTLMRKLQLEECNTSELWNLIEDCRRLCLENHCEIILSLVNPNANQLARKLTRVAIQVDGFRAWIEGLPPGVV